MSNQPLIKAIFFDGGDVLFRKVVNINEQIANYLGVVPDKYNSEEKELIKSDREIREAWEDIGTLEKEIEYFRMFNKKLLKSLGIVPSTEKVEFMTMCHVKRCYVLVEGIKEVLNYLSKKYQLGIISNCLVSRKYLELKDFKLEKYFSAVVLSREINIDKPHPDIFHYAVKQLDRKPHECAFVDNKIENLQTALNVGFGKVILFPRGDYKGKELLAIDSIKEHQQIF